MWICNGQSGRFHRSDLMGVTVVPLAHADEIVEKALAQAEREEKTRGWVAKGKTVEDLLAEFGRIRMEPEAGTSSMKKIFASRRHSRMSADWHMSPVVDTGDYVFFSGVTAAGPNGDAPSEPETQFRTAFEYLRENLEAAGLSFTDVVDLTSYHVDLRKQRCLRQNQRRVRVRSLSDLDRHWCQSTLVPRLTG